MNSVPGNSAPPIPPAPAVYFHLCLLSALAYFLLSEGIRGYVMFLLQTAHKIAEKLM